MKNSHKCPKCTSDAVYQIPIHKNLYGGTVGVGFFATVSIHRFICSGCGFTEEWVMPEDLEKVKKYAEEKGWEKDV